MYADGFVPIYFAENITCCHEWEFERITFGGSDVSTEEYSLFSRTFPGFFSRGRLYEIRGYPVVQ